MEPTEGKSPFFSQISHQAGRRSAHFSFITPDELDSDDSLAALIDFMCYQAGDMGALNVLADVEEAHPCLSAFATQAFARMAGNPSGAFQRTYPLINPDPVG